MAKPVSGETLAIVLEQRGISKAELARRMRVTPPSVASWLNSEQVPSQRVPRLRRILGPLTVSADEMPVPGSTLSEVMDRKGFSNSKLAEHMGVTAPAVAYWQKVETVPAKHVQRLVDILGPELMKGGTKPSVHTLKKKFEGLESKYRVSVQELADLAELSAPAIHNVFSGQTKSPRERTLRRLKKGLDELQAKYEEGDEKLGEERQDGEGSAERGNSYLGQYIKVHDRHGKAVESLDVAGVYILYGTHTVTYKGEDEPTKFHGAPEYVGQTGNIGRRMREYEDKWWFRGVDWIAYIEEADRAKRVRLENVLIRLLNPQFNVRRTG